MRKKHWSARAQACGLGGIAFLLAKFISKGHVVRLQLLDRRALGLREQNSGERLPRRAEAAIVDPSNPRACPRQHGVSSVRCVRCMGRSCMHSKLCMRWRTVFGASVRAIVDCNSKGDYRTHRERAGRTTWRAQSSCREEPRSCGKSGVVTREC